jgi:hypothetical protein
LALANAAQAEAKATALRAHSGLIQQAHLAEQARLRDEMLEACKLVALLRLVLVGMTLLVVVPLLWLKLHGSNRLQRRPTG